MKGRALYKNASNENWLRCFGILILVIGILTSFFIYNFIHVNNIYNVYGIVDIITDSRYFKGGEYPIRFLLNNQEYELRYKYSGRQYANASELLDAITKQLAVNRYVEMKVVKCFGTPMILEIKCNDLVFGDLQVTHREYKNDVIAMSLFSIFSIIVGVFLLLYSIKK